MRFKADQWIEAVQAKPEHVRIRYVVGCAAFAMLLVVGVWSLSVSESFRSISGAAEEAARESESLLPKASSFSLDALLSGEKSLEERKKEVSGEMFFQDALQSKTQPNFDEDGFVPQGTPTAPAPEDNSIDSMVPAR